MARHDVCAGEDVAAGALKAVKAGRATVVLTRLASGELRAVSGRCPHQGAALEFGCLTGLVEADRPGEMRVSRPAEILRCPWHGFEFDLATGEPMVPAPEGRRMRLRFHEVAEEDGRIWVVA